MEKRERNSNIELLRIISMLMIILYHILRRKYGMTSEERLAFSPYLYASNTVLGIWGLFGVYLFILISAWFQNGSKFRIKHVIGILFECFCYIAAYGVIGSILKYQPNGKEIVKYSILYIHDTFVYHNEHWFVAPYLMMCFMSPFLNLIQEKFTRRQSKTMILILAGLFLYHQFSGAIFSSSTMFLYIYFVVGYIKKYWHKKRNFAAGGGILLVMILFSALLADYGVNSGILSVLHSYAYRILRVDGLVSLLVMLASLCVFLAFVQRKERHNKVINFLGGLVFGVYLFHETYVFPMNGKNVTLVDVLRMKCEELQWIGSGALYPLQILLLAFAVMMMGMAVEYMRQVLLQRPFMKLMGKIDFTKVDRWFNVEDRRD